MTMQLQTTRGFSKTRGNDGIEVNLPFKSPYDWRTIIGFYQSHSIPGIERVTDDAFERVFRLENTIGFVQVRAPGAKPRLRVRIVPADAKIRLEVVKRIRKMFDLDCDPTLIAKHLGQDPLLETLCRRFPGLRLARGWDPFETAICAILGQLVSAEHRANLIGQLVSHYGEEIIDSSKAVKNRLFPNAAVLARSDLSAVRTTAARREAIRDFSGRVLSGAISLDDRQDPAALRPALLATKGFGPWSVEYVSLRAIGDTDAFPKTDLILKRVLDLHPDLDLERIKPWRSYAATYLWKEFAQTLSRSKKRETSMTLFYKEMESPVGKLKLVASANALLAVLWEQERPNRVKLATLKLDRQHPILLETERQLGEYFAGRRTAFDLPLEPTGSQFQKKVWLALRKIPFGQTQSYLDLAKTVGSVKAVRAVGGANGKNPLSIIVPCHRVVGANGALTGFAGGLDVKKKLLAFEAGAASLKERSHS
jgi:O-6-methylguanine DNA methyltransferase